MVAYWIAHVDVSDPDAYESYRKANAVAFNKYNGRFIVRGGKSKVVEGTVRSRTVVIEFDDYETAKACFDSSEYKEAMAHKLNCSEADVVIVEGYTPVE